MNDAAFRPILFRARRRGSASLAAMVVCLSGTMGLLGMIAIVQSRVAMVDSSEERAARRMRLLNGRQLAKEILYVRVLGSGSGPETTVALDGNWGRVTIPAWTSNPYTTNLQSAIANQVSPSPALPPYVTTLTASIFTVVDGSSSWSAPESFICNLNAQNTALAGYLLEARRPANAAAGNEVSGNLVVNGRALIFQNPGQNNSFAFDAGGVNAPVSALPLSHFQPGIPSRPDNLPMLPLPEGTGAGGYIKGDRTGVDSGGATLADLLRRVESQGQIFDAATAVNSNGIESDGSGVVNVALGNFNLAHTLFQGPLTTLNLIGQSNAAEAVAVENLAPVILITNSTTLATVNFSALNRRPLILANTVGEANSHLLISYVLPSGADFRVFFIQQDANTQFVLSGSAVIRGGLALDFSSTVSGGTLNVEEETNKDFFQLLLPRSAWLEAYRQL